MTTQSAKTSNAAALLVLLATTTGAFAQAAGSENSPAPKPQPNRASTGPVRQMPGNSTVSKPWWMRNTAETIQPMKDAKSDSDAQHAKGNALRARTFISKPDGPGLPHKAAAAHDTSSRPASITLSDGRILQRDGTITRDGEVVSRDTCINLPDGRTVPIADLLAREKATFNSDGTITLADGSIMKVEAAAPRDAAHETRRAASGGRGAVPAEPAAKEPGVPAWRRTSIPRATPAVPPTITPVSAPPVQASPPR